MSMTSDAQTSDGLDAQIERANASGHTPVVFVHLSSPGHALSTGGSTSSTDTSVAAPSPRPHPDVALEP